MPTALIMYPSSQSRPLEIQGTRSLPLLFLSIWPGQFDARLEFSHIPQRIR